MRQGDKPAAEEHMQIGMIGIGRMGANMSRRLLRAGHDVVVFDARVEAAKALEADGAVAGATIAAFIGRLQPPRVIWLMVPAAVVDTSIDQLLPHLNEDDVIIDGGNSPDRVDIRRARMLSAQRLHYVDVGTSGGVWGLERGYCLMIGGETGVVQRLEPIFAALAPGRGDIARTHGRDTRPSTAEDGYLHCGPAGAGHFVKMVHNGIEYGLMAAYAEGLNILRHANAGKVQRQVDAETTPLSRPEEFQYDLALDEISELWRRGSVISSWLLDLTAMALLEDPALEAFDGAVADSGEGRWTIQAAIEEGVPAHVLSAALYDRFASRGHADFAGRVLSAMRFGFGGHGKRA
jgi:6-phosphogluconate dehydrogenase